MTYNEKKSLYESIMKDVAKTVKRRLNESDLISREDASDIADQDEPEIFWNRGSKMQKLYNSISSMSPEMRNKIREILDRIDKDKKRDLNHHANE